MSRFPQPIPRLGPGKARWKRHHDHSRLEVMSRCHGHCEAIGCPNRATDWSHLAGRGHLIAEPFCSLAEMTAGLCRGHHNDVDRGLAPKLLADLRWIAVQRLVERFFPIEIAAYQPVIDVDPLDCLRELGRRLEAGWRWDPDRHTVVEIDVVAAHQALKESA